jgi:hypothetical protein
MGQRSTVRLSTGELRISRNGHNRKGKASVNAHSDDADARYATALKVVQAIDYNLQHGTRHYYDIHGRLLTTLDEVIHAALSDSLAIGRPAATLERDEPAEWIPLVQLVA